MYLAALNPMIEGAGMLSWIRIFTKIAHRMAPTAGKKASNSVLFLLFNKKSELKSVNSISTRITIKKEENKPLLVVPEKTPLKDISTTCFVYNSLEKTKANAGQTPALTAFLATNAKEAIAYAKETFGITKVVISGFNLLKAGLTVQTHLEAELSIEEYLVSHVAVATSDTSALDVQLQMVGRAFADIKGQKAPSPEDWAIHLMGVKDRAMVLQQYSALEENLADAGALGEPMFEALRAQFTEEELSRIDFVKLGLIGMRRGSIANLLNVTAESIRRAIATSNRSGSAASAASDASGTSDASAASSASGASSSNNP
jgi:hypothetical protein